MWAFIEEEEEEEKKKTQHIFTIHIDSSSVGMILMRLVDKESEWQDTQPKQKQSENKELWKPWTVSVSLVIILW